MELPPDVGNMPSGLQAFQEAPTAPAQNESVETASPKQVVDAEVVDAETPAEGGMKPVFTFIFVFLLTFASMMLILRLGGWPPDHRDGAPANVGASEETPTAVLRDPPVAIDVEMEE